MLRVGLAIGTIVALGLVGCSRSGSPPSNEGETTASPASATDSVKNSGGTGTSARAKTFSLNSRQARQVQVVLQFIDAFNAQRLREALALFSSDPVVSDCDYRGVEAVEFTGRREIESWLRQRFADRDRLEVSLIADENPAQPIGVAAVEYARRTSDTLRALGFRTGIEPQLATKVVFTTRGPVLIRTFANGPVGGSPELCQPG